MIRSSLAITFAVALTAAVAAHANVLSNPGFETGAFAPWYHAADFSGGEGEDWHVTTTTVHSGTYSATVVGNKRIQQDFAPIPVSDILEASFWIQQDEYSSAFAVYFHYEGGSNEQVDVSSTDPSWRFYDFTADLDVGKKLVGFGVWGYVGGGGGFPSVDRTFVDDLVLRVVPEPAAATMLVAPWAAHFARRGRRRF